MKNGQNDPSNQVSVITARGETEKENTEGDPKDLIGSPN